MIERPVKGLNRDRQRFVSQMTLTQSILDVSRDNRKRWFENEQACIYLKMKIPSNMVVLAHFCILSLMITFNPLWHLYWDNKLKTEGERTNSTSVLIYEPVICVTDWKILIEYRYKQKNESTVETRLTATIPKQSLRLSDFLAPATPWSQSQGRSLKRGSTVSLFRVHFILQLMETLYGCVTS